MSAKTASPTEGSMTIEEKIVQFLIGREDEHRRNLIGQTGEARERLLSAMLENFWLRRAVESGKITGRTGKGSH